tara:strand:+ start:9442 stop:9729 length:288 start_codon:yes stop_codon:yes gene_type:complete
MTRWDKKVKKPNWDSLIEWEKINNALVMWVVTPNCILERAKERGVTLKANKEQIYEFCYQTKRGYDMDVIKSHFKDFVIENLIAEYGGKENESTK